VRRSLVRRLEGENRHRPKGYAGYCHRGFFMYTKKYKDDLNIIERLEILDNDKTTPLCLYRQSKKYHDSFCVLLAHEIEQAKAKENSIPDISVCIMLWHLSIELLLKALIRLNGEKPKYSHHLIDLMTTVKQYYPDEINISSNNTILNMLSKDFISMRYLEVFIFQIDADKLNVFLEQCQDIYFSIYKIWDRSMIKSAIESSLEPSLTKGK
jgi:HEPN domain-containing protein